MAKKMTIEDLAGMVQRGFEQTSTKEELNNLRSELRETREILSQAIKDLEMRMSAYFNFDKQEIDRLKSWMENIEERITLLENKQAKKK